MRAPYLKIKYKCMKKRKENQSHSWRVTSHKSVFKLTFECISSFRNKVNFRVKCKYVKTERTRLFRICRTRSATFFVIVTTWMTNHVKHNTLNMMTLSHVKFLKGPQLSKSGMSTKAKFLPEKKEKIISISLFVCILITRINTCARGICFEWSSARQGTPKLLVLNIEMHI